MLWLKHNKSKPGEFEVERFIPSESEGSYFRVWVEDGLE